MSEGDQETGTQEPQAKDERPTKKCPKCAEEVLAEAEKCKHCGANVKGLDGVDATAGVLLGLLVVGAVIFVMFKYGDCLTACAS